MADASINHRELAILRDILDLTREGHPETPQERVFQLLEHLEVLIGSDGASLQQMDAIHRCRTFGQVVDGGERWLPTAEDLDLASAPGIDTFWKYWWTSPCSLPDRTGTSMVVSLRSFYSQRQWNSSPMHADCVSASDQILVAYPTGPGCSTRLLLHRNTGSAFGDRQLTLMRGLRPHLKGLMQSAIAPSQPTAVPRLTDRQMEILRQVGKGLTNREVARVLGIREATVRKHLEHSYLRLGVLSRTGAVTAVFGLRPAS